MSDAFPPDEFDEIAQRGGPVGVHRAPRPWWSRLLAPILVFLIAGAVAYLIATYLWSQDATTPEEPTPTFTETSEAVVTPTNSATPSPSNAPSSPSASPEPTQEVNLAAKIAVLNGSGIKGLAAASQKTLTSSGFTSVTAGNLSGDKPKANVVVYADDAMKATATKVAADLGIDEISHDVTRTSVDVEVQLVSDPSK